MLEVGWRVTATLAVVLLAGCSSAPAAPLRTVPHEHEARTGLTGGTPAGEKIIAMGDPTKLTVDRAPPPPIAEVPRYDDQPLGHVWIPGYWRWDTEVLDHVWVPGGWMRPPRERAWIAARWVATDDGRYRFLPGYWN